MIHVVAILEKIEIKTMILNQILVEIQPNQGKKFSVAAFRENLNSLLLNHIKYDGQNLFFDKQEQEQEYEQT